MKKEILLPQNATSIPHVQTELRKIKKNFQYIEEEINGGGDTPGIRQELNNAIYGKTPVNLGEVSEAEDYVSRVNSRTDSIILDENNIPDKLITFEGDEYDIIFKNNKYYVDNEVDLSPIALYYYQDKYILVIDTWDNEYIAYVQDSEGNPIDQPVFNINGVEYYLDDKYTLTDVKSLIALQKQVDVPTYVEIKYYALKELKDNNKLVPGTWYRITDYQTLVAYPGVTCAETHFDVIVQAINENTFNQNARAIEKDDGYLTTFGANPRKWDIKYDFDSNGQYGQSIPLWLYKTKTNKYFIDKNHNTITELSDSNFDCAYLDKDSDEYKYYNIGYDTKRNAILINGIDSNNNDVCYIGEDGKTVQSIDDETLATVLGIEVGDVIGEDITLVGYSTGYIYEMTDEFNNTCPYDFKTIQFMRMKIKDWDKVYIATDFDEDGDYHYQTDAAAKWLAEQLYNDRTNKSNLGLWFQRGTCDEDVTYVSSPYLGYDNYHPVVRENNQFVISSDELGKEDKLDGKIFVQFSYVCDNSWGMIAEVEQDPYYFFTFSAMNNNNQIIDASIVAKAATIDNVTWNTSNVYDNKINNRNKEKRPNDITFANKNTLSVCANEFKFGCYSNSFGNEIYNNTFGNNIYDNTFGNEIYRNSFGNNISYNTFGNYVQYNTFVNNISYNTFGNGIWYNTFGNYVTNNTFGNEIYNNTFGNDINYNTFGNNINRNTFGNNVYNNTFGNSVGYNTFGNDFYNFIVPNSLQYVLTLNGLEGSDSFDRTDLSEIVSNSQILAKDSNDNFVAGNLGDLFANQQ